MSAARPDMRDAQPGVTDAPSEVSSPRLDALDAQLRDTLLWLCAIPSPTGEERALCDAIATRLSSARLAGPLRRIGDSLVVPWTRIPGAPHVVLAGHLDTVRTENGPARLDAGRVFGAGASDMKSGLAVMLALVETLPPAAVRASVTLVFYAGEEGPYAENELGPVLDQSPELAAVDLAVCLEPSDNKLALGCNGSLHATVTFHGRTAHSSRPWQGESAISRAVPFLAELDARAPADVALDGLVYRTVTTVTSAVDGGRGRNVVPDRFVLNVNHRFTPDTAVERAQQDVLAMVAGRGEVVFTDLSPGAMPRASHPLVQRLVASGVHAIEPKQAWTDVARFFARGTPAVNFGPGENAQAHQKNESTAIAPLGEGFRILSRWLANLRADPV